MLSIFFNDDQAGIEKKHAETRHADDDPDDGNGEEGHGMNRNFQLPFLMAMGLKHRFQKTWPETRITMNASTFLCGSPSWVWTLQVMMKRPAAR